MKKYLLLLFIWSGCETKQTELIDPNLLKSVNASKQTISDVPEAKKPVNVTVKREVSPPSEDELDPEASAQVPDNYLNPDIPLPDVLPDEFGDSLYDGLVVIGVCGDGKRSPTEQCDDGNSDNLDGCNVLCRFPVCGNGVLEKGEWCDDANNTNGDGCNKVCEFERCGNGSMDTGEQCDDANLENGDGCSKACWREVCGNSIIDVGEECDDGNVLNADGCSKFCEIENCGNGKITPNEQCDDANHVSGDGCSSTCTLETI